MYKYIISIAILIVAVLSILSLDDARIPERVLFLSAFHPVAVHFPIALIFVVNVFGIVKKFRQRCVTEFGFGILVYLCAVITFIAFLLGYTTAITEGFSGKSFSYHRYLAGLLAVSSLLLALFHNKIRQLSRVKEIICHTIVLFLLLLTGYWGGVLTHGENHFSLARLNFNKLQDLAKLEDSLPSQIKIAFNEEVHPIFDGQCVECHGPDKRRGGLRLDSLRGILAGGSEGPVVEFTGDSTPNLIKRVSLPVDHSDFMPKDGNALSEQELATLRGWITQVSELGPLNPNGFHAAQVRNRNLAPPTVHLNSEVNEIDYFVEKYFKGISFDWPQRASDKNLVIRLYVDLIGRMPNQEEFRVAIALAKGGNSNILIDQLLDSKLEYTLHWLSFWNDLLRNDYSGVGFIDQSRKQLTAWLISALYKNHSYLQMMTDLLTESNGAEAFLYGINWRGSAQAHQVPAIQAAQNVSNIFLGLDMRCASCHDSFTNSWRLKDVYQFAQIFAENELELHRCGKTLGSKASSQFIFPNIKPAINSMKREVRLTQLAQAMQSKQNGNFPIAFVNRVWKRLIGRGLIEPVYNIDQAPWSDELLHWLAHDFRNSNYDIKVLLKTIVSSRTYQLERQSFQAADSDSYVFKGPHVAKLTAEQLIDSIFSISSSWPEPTKEMLTESEDGTGGQLAAFTSVTSLPEDGSAVRASLMANNSLLRALGRPERAQTISDRTNIITPWNLVQLLDDETLEPYILDLVRSIGEEAETRDEQVALIFQKLLFRSPSSSEFEIFSKGLNSQELSLKDLVWSIIFIPEFLIVS